MPLVTPLLLAVPVGSMLAWKRGDLAGVLGRLSAALVVVVVVVIGALALRDLRFSLALLGLGLGVWVIAGSLIELAGRAGLFQTGLARVLPRAMALPRTAWAMALAHVGIGVLVLGVTVSGTGRVEHILTMRPGETTDLAGYRVRLDGIEPVQGPNYAAQRATFTVSSGGAPVVTLRSEKRSFPLEQMTTTQAGIDTSLWRDLYLVIGDAAQNGAFTVRLYYNPLVFWIWGGAGLMGLGGLLSLTDRRLRVGAPGPARLTPRAAGA